MESAIYQVLTKTQQEQVDEILKEKQKQKQKEIKKQKKIEKYKKEQETIEYNKTKEIEWNIFIYSCIFTCIFLFLCIINPIEAVRGFLFAGTIAGFIFNWFMITLYMETQF